MSVRNFDPLAEVYDDTRGGEQHGIASASRLTRHLPEGGRVIELGVGTGLVAAALDAQVVGVDISAAMLARALARIGRRVLRADACTLPFAAATFDAGYAVWLLHLVDDKASVFNEVVRVLRPRAPFIVEPAGFFAEGEIQDIVQRLYADVLGTTERNDAAERLVAIAESIGFDLIEVDEIAVPFVKTPLEVVADIERRTGSAFHALTDDEWSVLVEPHLELLRALPEPDRPRQSVRVDPQLVFRSP